MNRRELRWGIAAAGSVLLSACNDVQSALAPVADESRAIERVWDLMLWI